MTICEDKIKTLKIIFQRDYGKDIDEATAKSMACWILDYCKIMVDIEREQ